MTDDEAFVRRIVDSPGDDLPRLVYADWLDERGDPRGAYLRAEREACHTGDTAAMRNLAAEIDPVWVARVSLPPFGVCCEHMELRDRGPAITDADIDRFERQYELRLPADYRASLLNYNGGVVTEGQWETSDGLVIDFGMEHKFYSLGVTSGTGQGHGLDWWVEFRHEYLARHRSENGDLPEHDVEEWFLRFITVGQPEDAIFGLLLGVAGAEFGQVQCFDYSVGFYPGFLDHRHQPYAASFGQYLSTLPTTGSQI